MNKEDLKNIIIKNLEDKTEEIKRVFHGRGNYYKNFSHLTVDSLDDTLFTVFFEELEDEYEIIGLLKELSQEFKFRNLIIQRKYRKDNFYDSIIGEIPNGFLAIENGLKYKIDFKNRNIGLFFDIKNAREYIKNSSKDKRVLNLFSYTCAFSVAAISGGAKSVINIDMNRNSLNIGRENHHINGLDTKDVKFFSYDILKSFGKIKKISPYDIVIIDPPSFQKGSFIATKDYEKIVKRLDDITISGSMILACINDPFIESFYIKELFEKYLKNFSFKESIKQSDDFLINNIERGLKTLVFIKA